MARPLRIEFDGAWYHVMNRGAGKRDVFRSRPHFEAFLRLLGEASRIYGLAVHAYCLMGNHYHLLVQTPIAGLGRAMRHIDGVYTQRFNRNTDTDGPLFRGRYRSVLIEAEAHLWAVGRYIHLNPVAADLVERPEDYEFSSYPDFLGLRRAPSWLHIAETLERFAPDTCRDEYRRFVEKGVDEDTRAFFGAERVRPILGSESFRDDVRSRAPVDGRLNHEVPGMAELANRPSLDEIAAAVCGAFGVTLDELRCLRRSRSRGTLARGALVHLGREIGGESSAAISRWVGFRSYAGAAKSMLRLRDAMSERIEVRQTVKDALRRLGQDRPRGSEV